MNEWTIPNRSCGICCSNQFFDEPQWESYRRLGEHIGTFLFAGNSGLWFRDLLDSESQTTDPADLAD